MSESVKPLPVSTEPVPPMEQRSWDRYVCNFKCYCKLIEHPQTSAPWPAKVRDISKNGVRLMLCRRFEPGTLMAVELHDASECVRLLLSRVVRVTKKTHNRWIHGCVFGSALTDEELESLVDCPSTGWIQREAEASRVEPISSSAECPMPN